MTKRAKERQSVGLPSIRPGDHVLLGATKGSYPCHWFLDRVLWAGTSEVLVERTGANGLTWRALAHKSEVRAVGSIAQLGKVKQECSEAVSDLQRQLAEQEHKLACAQTELWRRVRQWATEGGRIIPPDFDLIEAERQAGLSGEGGPTP